MKLQIDMATSNQKRDIAPKYCIKFPAERKSPHCGGGNQLIFPSGKTSITQIANGFLFSSNNYQEPEVNGEN